MSKLTSCNYIKDSNYTKGSVGKSVCAFALPGIMGSPVLSLLGSDGEGSQPPP